MHYFRIAETDRPVARDLKLSERVSLDELLDRVRTHTDDMVDDLSHGLLLIISALRQGTIGVCEQDVAAGPPLTSLLVLHPRNPVVTWKGLAVRFTRSELAVLALLAASPQHYVSHQSLHRVAKNNGGPRLNSVHFKRNLRTTIRRIRLKFLAVDPEFRALTAKIGFGYCWDEER